MPTTQSASLIAALTRHPELQDRRVLDAIGRVPRDRFVPPEYREFAWQDRALPIGHGATISQPYVVAFMTQSAQLSAGDRVLEVGTGSGYQAAVLAELGAEVYSVEMEPALHESARALLEQLGYRHVHLRHGDGAAGWAEAAPFHAILVTAAAPGIPAALAAQLGQGGRLVVPLGGHDEQLLKVFVKTRAGLEPEAQVPVRFVPLRRLD